MTIRPSRSVLLGLGGAVAASLAATGTGAQPYTPPDSPYGGHGPAAFYDLDRREVALDGRIRAGFASGGLSPGRAARASAALRAIRGEEAYRRDRHGGELRDWDRELLTRKLNELAAGLPR